MIDISFDKMEGAGNDFIFIDHRKRLVDDADKQRLVRDIAHRRFGVGADGVVFIENHPDPQLAFAWDFYNADGSSADMCGNAARCATRFARAHGIVSEDRFRFGTVAGIIQAEWFPDGARVALGQADAPRLFRDLEAGAPAPDADPNAKDQTRRFDAWLLNTGVPHAVVDVGDMDMENVEVEAWGRRLRYHAAFAPAGTNVDFIARDPDASAGDGLLIRTYERGVEGETLACGTGAAASAVVAAKLFGMKAPIRLRVRGGQVLSIGWDEIAPDGSAKGLTLAGPARLVFSGNYAWGE